MAGDDEGLRACFDDEVSALYREIYPRLLRYLVSCGADQVFAEEVIIDAFLVALRSWEEIRRYDKPAAYVFKVVTNLWLWCRARGVGQAQELSTADVPDWAGAADPQETVIAEMRLYGLLMRLSERQRQVLLLEYAYGFEISAIAAILGVNEGTVKRCGHDGRVRLAALFEEEGGVGV